MQQTKINISLLLVFSLLVASGAATNVCGGSRPITNGNRLGELCETNLKTDCPFGRFACASADTLRCLPDCSLTLSTLKNGLCSEPSVVEKIVIVEKEKEEVLPCLNGGSKTCSCPSNYKGEQCEIFDVCMNVDCGNNGRCENGQCVCNELFLGERCEVHSGCTAKGFQWTGKTCKCAEGYVGPHCNQCDPTLICIPNNKTGDYTSMYINDQSIIEEILAAGKLPDYALIPYRPNVRSAMGCSCSPQQQQQQEKGGSLTSNYVEGSNDSPFVHHFYRATYKQSRTSSGFSWVWAVTSFLFVATIIVGGVTMAKLRKSNEVLRRKTSRPEPIIEKFHFPMKK